MPNDAIKCAKEALLIEKINPKAHYRIYLAYKSLNNLDKAEEHLKLAINCEPNDRGMRAELKKFSEEKSAKEKLWYSKMAGFYQGTKLSQIEDEDNEQAILREKIER